MLSAFRIDACAVSNADFAAFVAGTGYITEAERFGSSFVFGGLLPDDFPPTQGVASAPWWRLVEWADWAHPEGPQSNVRDRQAHPVVHVSHADASAFCAWRASGCRPSRSGSPQRAAAWSGSRSRGARSWNRGALTV
jgi:formylglycine-generating enzyme